MGKPELLSPAGDRERLDMALAYGADAVYLAGNAYGMRAFAGNFGREALAEDPGMSAQRRAFAQQSSWAERAAQVASIFEAVGLF